MTTEVEFAPSYGRDDDKPHIYLFPRDVDWRREYYPAEVMQHPAKMQLHIVKCCVEYFEATGVLTKGASILDPFGGTGTSAIACTMGHHVTLIELEDVFLSILVQLRKNWRERGIEPPTVLSGDSRQVIKELADSSFDMIITSPPYANLQVGKEATEFTGGLAKHKAQLRQYGSSESSNANFGRMNTFTFNQHMSRMYEQFKRVLKPGGVYVSVTKDQMKANVRQRLGAEVIRTVNEAGLPLGGWWKWKPPGGMLQSVMKSKGSEVVEDEDILWFKKP